MQIKLGLSLLWRVIALQLAFTIIFFVLLKNTELMSNPEFMQLKPSVLTAGYGLFLLMTTFILKNGLVYVVLGHRLNKNRIFWKKFTLALSVLYLLISILNFAVANAASVEFWLQYKTFGPLVLLLFFCVTAPRYIERFNSSLHTAPSGQ